MHDLKPNSLHAVVNCQVVICPKYANSPDNINDGLGEIFRSEIGAGFIADYAFFNTDNPALVMTSEEPEEGELISESLISSKLAMQSPQGGLHNSLQQADRISINGTPVSNFHLYDYEPDVDGDNEEIYLDAGEGSGDYNFSSKDVRDAVKVCNTWVIKHKDEEFKLACEKIISF